MGQYVLLIVVALTVGAVVFGVTVLVSGDDPGLGAVEPDGRAVPLPATRPLVESDIATVRFDTAVRGYRMAQVDRAMHRAAYDIGYKDELISVLEAEVAALREGRTDDAEVLRRAREAALTSNTTGIDDAERDGFSGAPEPSVAQGPVPDEPASDEPASDEPASDEPASDEPASDEPASDEPASDEPASDEPASDEPASDEPASDEPASDEPAPVDTAAPLDHSGSAAAESAGSERDAAEPAAAEPDGSERHAAEPAEPAEPAESAERGVPGQQSGQQSGRHGEPADDQTGESYPATAERR
jgi:DivIVA domain-containing protein